MPTRAGTRLTRDEPAKGQKTNSKTSRKPAAPVRISKRHDSGKNAVTTKSPHLRGVMANNKEGAKRTREQAPSIDGDAPLKKAKLATAG